MTGSSREAEPVIVARLFVPSSKVLAFEIKNKLIYFVLSSLIRTFARNNL